LKDKIKIGVFFGGRSREREVSFAGGRTVYDNLDKSIFEPVPIFVDSFGQFIILDWQYIYKGTIRDFYPPTPFLEGFSNDYQVYAESLELSFNDKKKLANSVGNIIYPHEFSTLFDFAFLALHGSYGEDGFIQGLLEWYDIPYSGSGLLGSSIGINKKIQKQLFPANNSIFSMAPSESINRETWFDLSFDKQSFYTVLQNKLGLPFVIKSANQGSSIGVSILKNNSFEEFEKYVNQSFFILELEKKQWENIENKKQFIREICETKSSLGLPLIIQDKLYYRPEEVLEYLLEYFTYNEKITISALEKETDVLFEPFVDGREFSCIVLKTEKGEPLALPPTEIIKTTQFYDYTSKYLPGLSRKVTPMQVESNILDKIRRSCETLVHHFDFKVYARIDGFVTKSGEILLNDPNTTSGMMPSSFFFHQAAEIGLNPSEFLTLIIQNSIHERINNRGVSFEMEQLFKKLKERRSDSKEVQLSKEKIAVILGGNSFERHISVESGRNVFEKLVSSGKYEVDALFLDYTNEKIRLFKLPVSILLKDNADDIREKVFCPEIQTDLVKIRNEFKQLTEEFVKRTVNFEVQEIPLNSLADFYDGAFIALHGRPGEDGTIQKELDKLGLFYNGSDSYSSSITIDKFETIQRLNKAGFKVTKQLLIDKNDWLENKNSITEEIEKQLDYPLIAKPHDDGCSSAVVKIKNLKDLEVYASIMFREEEEGIGKLKEQIGLKSQDEFPKKNCLLLEKLINKENAIHFLEITGGMLTKYNESGEVVYEVFEPSEALAEGEILSLEEKFLAGQGQNITPARYSNDPLKQSQISEKVKQHLLAVAKELKVEGYCRIDAFVRIFENLEVEVIVIEVNSLPGMTPATCIYHQAAIQDLKPFNFIDSILSFGKQRLENKK
jgi:UDP-N-acetylmuramate--alanine ligase